MQVERFFHLRTLAQCGGATVRVVGDPEKVGKVYVQTAFCHTKQGALTKQKQADPYCKKTGRDTAIAAPMKEVALRYLPAELNRIRAETLRRVNEPGYVVEPDYSFAMKYFLPKE